MTRQEATEIAAGIYSTKVTEIAAECIAESSMHESDKAVLSSRLRGLQRVYDQCRAAGFIDDNGAVRKVLGHLPITGDACFIGLDATVYMSDGETANGDIEVMPTIPVRWDECRAALRLFSTPDAAEAARREGGA